MFMAQTFPHAFVRASDATNTLTHKHLGVGFKILMLGVDFTHAHFQPNSSAQAMPRTLLHASIGD